MPIFHDMAQGSADWWRIRIGIPTASQFHKIITPKTRKLSGQAGGYMDRLLAERLLKDVMDDQLNGISWIERGKTREPEAGRALEKEHGLALRTIGFVTTDDGRIGASPDRLIVPKPPKIRVTEAVEIKCPLPPTMVRYNRDGPGEDYWAQVQGQMYVGGFEAVHFFAHHPRMPSKYILYIRDEAFIKDLAAALDQFCDQLDKAEAKARRLGAYVESDWFRERRVPEAWDYIPPLEAE